MLAIGNYQGYFTHLNPAWEKILGFTCEELKAQPLTEFVHPADVEATQAEIEKLAAGISITSRFENRYRCKDGSYKWLSWTAVAFLEEGLIYCIARDVSDAYDELCLRQQAEASLQKANEQLESTVEERTAHLRQVNDELVTEIVERRQVEIALRKSEQRYRTLVETIPYGIVEIDTTGIIIFSNWAYQSMLGYAEEELLGKSIVDLAPESNFHIILEYLAGQEQDQLPSTPYVGQLLTKDGKLIDVQADWNYKQNNQGRVTGLISIVTDITHRQTMEEALRTSDQRFRIALQNSPTVVFTQDTDFRYTWIYNPALGYDAEAVVGKLESEIFSLEDAQRLAAIKRRVLTTGVGTRKQTFVTFNGDVRHYDLTVEALHNQAGEIVGVTCAATDITDIHAREEALRASEQQLRTALEAAHMGTWDWNILTGQITWSDNFKLFLGIETDSLDGSYENFIASIHPEDRDRVLQKIERTFQAGEDFEDEFRIILPNDNIRWLACKGQAFYDETGKPIRMTGLALDVTERKMAEAARQKTEELYRTLASNFPNGVVALFDKDLRYTLTEGKGLAEVGLSKEFLVGKTLAEIFPPKVCQIKEQAYRGALDGNPTICEIPFDDRVYLMYTLPLRNERGEIYAGMSMSQDITARKRAELALLEERNFVSAILDTAGALIVVADQQGRIIRFNRACEQITGYCFEEVRGKYVWEQFLIPEEVKPVQTLVQELQAGQFPKEHENYWVAKDGDRRRISWSTTVILDSEKSAKYLIGIGIDITERKRTEEIRRALEREQELSILRLRFFSMVSHEFRTPLSTILISAQSLESRAHEWPEEKRRKSLRRIASAAKHLTQLLDHILTINRAETRKLEFSPQPIDLEKFCRTLLEEIQLQATPQHTIIFVSQGNCPNVLVDEKILRSIITNLLSNAIKYSPNGGEISLILTFQKQEIIFQIRDQGIGIPLSDQCHLFEPFHRGENVGNIPGTGLGITVVKKCLDLHGGKISLTSEVGVGTTVTVTIPEQQQASCPL
jgi:PAS domain S-box-containing protein